MKRISLFVAVIITLLSFPSCRKDHTCTCTFNNPAVAATPQLTALSYKSDAQTWCAAYQNQQNSNGVTGWTCTVN